MNHFATNHDPGEPLFDALAEQPGDALLALIGAFRDDSRTDKLDLGVGVYRNEAGRTPVMRAVKEAERRLLDSQSTKSYLGPEGDTGFIEALKGVIFGKDEFGARLTGLQTPGGTGALRLSAELIGRARLNARIITGTPTWPNHLPIFQSAGLQVAVFQHFDLAGQQLTFGRLVSALDSANPGDVVLLHGCCHNPTGADFSLEQWAMIGGLVRERRLMPLVDLAYQGLGAGLDADAAGVRLMLQIVGEGLIAYSCDKNFGLYRERVGALFALSRSSAQAHVVQSNLLSLARANWSMPPDHGAAIVRVILEDESLNADWKAELAGMSQRIRDVRAAISLSSPTLAPLAEQQGMFSTLALTGDDVRRLRSEHGIFMPSSGRINIAGLTPATVPKFVAALATIA